MAHNQHTKKGANHKKQKKTNKGLGTLNKTPYEQTIIAIDLDGTLLDDHKGVDIERLTRVVHKLRRQDTHVVACTGNTVERARLHLGDAWGAVEYLICDNGGVVAAHDDRLPHRNNLRVLFQKTIANQDVTALADVLTGRGNFSNGVSPRDEVAVIFNTTTHSYLVSESAHNAEHARDTYYRNRGESTPAGVGALEYFDHIYPGVSYVPWERVRTQYAGAITKFALNTKDYEKVPGVVDTLTRNLGASAARLEFAPSGYGAIAVTPTGVNKGTGIRNLLVFSKIAASAKQLRDNPDLLAGGGDVRAHVPGVRVIAIGDEYNDVPMFGFADVAVAMGNARDGVKQAADVVLPGTNNTGAVLDYLEELAGPRIL